MDGITSAGVDVIDIGMVPTPVLYFATDSGLGWLIMDAWGFGDNLIMFVGILGMSVLGLFLYAAISLGERLCCSWMKPSS